MSVNPLDIRTVLLARHAQHVVLIHFPIALFTAAVAFDYLGQWTKSRALAAAAYFNLRLAAVSTVPVVATGFVAWQWALEGQKLEGILLMHLALGCISSVLIWLVFLDPLARATPSRGTLAKIPAADRSGCGVACGVDGASRRVSQWRKRARLNAPGSIL